MNLLYCGDGNVEQGLALSALSCAEHSDTPLKIYLLTAQWETHRAISPHFAERLQSVLQTIHPQNRVFLFDVTPAFVKEFPHANRDTRFTPFCTLRLFADDIAEIPDRVLYLDTDVLCRKDLAPLWQWNMKGAEMAGVPDRYGKWFFQNPLRHSYLNSGVLLLDLARIRQSGLFARCRRLCREKKMFMPDQTALNHLAKKTKLPRKFNEQGPIRGDTVLKHFTTFFRFFPFVRTVTVKPWQERELHEVLKIFEFDDLLEKYKKEFTQ